MILSFSTQLNGKPTYFVEKIWSGFKANDMLFPGASLETKNEEYLHRFGKSPFECKKHFNPKITTIREDKNERWTEETWIDFCINPRSKTMFNFAPRFRVISIQRIEIKHYKGVVQVYIDGEWFGDSFFDIFNSVEGYNLDLETLSQNDGFESLDDFFQYFDKDFKGKIIHWTDFKY